MPPRPRKARRERDPYDMLQDLKKAVWHLRECRKLMRACGCRQSSIDATWKLWKTLEGSIRFMNELNQRKIQASKQHKS